MTTMKKMLLGAAALVGYVGVQAWAGGTYTPYLPQIGPQVFNGTTVSPAPGNATQTTANMLVPMDTGLASGQSPQTVAASVFDIASYYNSMAGNTATSTVHAATLNTQGGIITTESLNTAAGATYTFTLTNSQITATNTTLQAAMNSITNTGGQITLTSITPAAGSATFVWTNTGSTAFNGTMSIAFHI